MISTDSSVLIKKVTSKSFGKSFWREKKSFVELVKSCASDINRQKKLDSISSGEEKGATVDGRGRIAVLNMLADELRHLRQEVQELQGNHEHRQLSM